MNARLAIPPRRRSKTGWAIFGSVLLHAAFVAGVYWSGKAPRKKDLRTVVVAAPKPKPKPKAPEEEAPKPKPPPPPPPTKAAPVVAPVAAPPPAAAPKAAGAHMASGLTLGNGGPSSGGVAVGGLSNTPGPSQPTPHDEKSAKNPPAAKAEACDEADTKPKPSGTLQVDYPDKARAEGIEGRIQVRIHVGDDGAVTSLEVVEGIEPSLDAVVLSVLRTWKFHPATHCGKPVPGVLAWAQRFELGD